MLDNASNAEASAFVFAVFCAASAADTASLAVFCAVATLLFVVTKLLLSEVRELPWLVSVFPCCVTVELKDESAEAFAAIKLPVSVEAAEYAVAIVPLSN